MVTFEAFRKLALSFPEASEQPHFEKTSFRIGTKIFATYDKKNHRACMKFSEIDQDIFSSFDRTLIYPIPNKWGKLGWTFFELKHLRKNIISEALATAYGEVAPKKLSALVRK